MMPTQEISNLLILEPIKFKEYPSLGTLKWSNKATTKEFLLVLMTTITKEQINTEKFIWGILERKNKW